MSRKPNTPKESQPDKTAGPVKLESAQIKLLNDTTRYLVLNAIRRQPDLQRIDGAVNFTRVPLTDGAMRAARDVVQSAACSDPVWPGKETEVISEFVRDAPESDTGKIKFTITPKA